MKIDFTLEDVKAIDDILDDLKNNGQFLLEPESCEANKFARYMVYAKYIDSCGFVKTSHIKNYGISLYGISLLGLDFINRGGLSKMDTENKDKEAYLKEKDDLERSVLALQQNELEYNKKIRLWKLISLILGVIVTLLSIYALFSK